jgi:hypothetical protein
VGRVKATSGGRARALQISKLWTACNGYNHELRESNDEKGRVGYAGKRLKRRKGRNCEPVRKLKLMILLAGRYGR